MQEEEGEKEKNDSPFTVDANRMEGKHSKIMRTSNMFTICSFQWFPRYK